MSDVIGPFGGSLLTERRVRADVELVMEGPWGEEISDSTARTIASWWQSSGTVGSILASVACGCTVSVDALLDDIYYTTGAWRDITPSSEDGRALGCLATWTMNHPTRREACPDCLRRMARITGDGGHDHDRRR